MSTKPLAKISGLEADIILDTEAVDSYIRNYMRGQICGAVTKYFNENGGLSVWSMNTMKRCIKEMINENAMKEHIGRCIVEQISKGEIKAIIGETFNNLLFKTIVSNAGNTEHETPLELKPCPTCGGCPDLATGLQTDRAECTISCSYCGKKVSSKQEIFNTRSISDARGAVDMQKIKAETAAKWNNQ